MSISPAHSLRFRLPPPALCRATAAALVARRRAAAVTATHPFIEAAKLLRVGRHLLVEVFAAGVLDVRAAEDPACGAEGLRRADLALRVRLGRVLGPESAEVVACLDLGVLRLVEPRSGEGDGVVADGISKKPGEQRAHGLRETRSHLIRKVRVAEEDAKVDGPHEVDDAKRARNQLIHVGGIGKGYFLLLDDAATLVLQVHWKVSLALVSSNFGSNGQVGKHIDNGSIGCHLRLSVKSNKDVQHETFVVVTVADGGLRRRQDGRKLRGGNRSAVLADDGGRGSELLLL
mmetsp:Transcript_24457/g.45748  ORF Transcript_24457/g.45748 Transcript_24457/m.45748 type:complete len:289 (-) Transcript_24457:170-1036(-)